MEVAPLLGFRRVIVDPVVVVPANRHPSVDPVEKPVAPTPGVVDIGCPFAATVELALRVKLQELDPQLAVAALLRNALTLALGKLAGRAPE